jgi:hypothetical protein
MVPSSALTVSNDSEHLMCGRFSLGEIVHLGSFEVITDYFGGLSLSPRRSESGVTFMGSTCSRTPSPWQATIEDSAEEFHMASSGEDGSGLPSPRRHGTGAPPTPVTATSWLENALATRAKTIVPPRVAASQPNTGIPFE